MTPLLRIRVFRWWAGVVHRRPRAIIAVCILLAVAGLVLAAARLDFRSNRSELVSQELPWNSRFTWWAETFPAGQDLLVVVDTRGARGRDGRARSEALVRELGPALRSAPRVRDAAWGFDPASASAKAIRLLPMSDFEKRLRQLRQSAAVLAAPSPASLLGAALRRLGDVSGEDAGGADAAGSAEAFIRLLVTIRQRLDLPAEEPFDFAAAVEPGEPWRFFETDNGRLLFIRISPELEEGSLNAAEPAIRSVRAVLAEYRARYADVPMGLTGAEVIEADETSVAMRDSTYTSLLAAALITLLLVTSFHGWRVPLMIVLTLCIAIAWSFGFLTLAVGHLQVVSVVYTIILLALGAGFGIHLAARYEMVRHNYPDHVEGAPQSTGFRDALGDVLVTTGPGVATGAITTAAAFVATVFTDFRGVAEMGLIAGAGVLLCLLAFLTMFAALLRLVEPGHAHVVALEARPLRFFHEEWFLPVCRHPKVVVGVTLAVVVVSLLGVASMRYDYNLLALLPRGVDSVTWQARIVEQGRQSPYVGVTIATSLEEARERALALRALPAVATVGGIARLFPPDEEAKLRRLASVRDELAPLLAAIEEAPDEPAGPPDDLLGRLSALRLALGLAQARVPEAWRDVLAEAQQEISLTLTRAAALSPAEREARLRALQLDYAAWRMSVAQRIAAALDPSPLTPDDLPAGVLAPFIAERDGQTFYSLDIYPVASAQAEDALEPGAMRHFIAEVRTVDPEVTGLLVQVYESGTLIWCSYVAAGALAMLAVFALCWIDFRNVRDAALSLAPVASGFALTFAILWLVGQRINPANIIVLPLMFGIGVDSGVHMIHRYRQHPEERPRGLTHGTGKGITITALTTIIGFGSMMLASHRGIAGLGFVLALGIAMTLLACLTLMPAWLELRRR